ncbi:MAG: type II toxin-antitoxin system RelE/ParE family toxin [Clostridia bacterium]|nr:type II toxin-antitoxin system RelE/ParE family toxin [Clostridia bacterium]
MKKSNALCTLFLPHAHYPSIEVVNAKEFLQFHARIAQLLSAPFETQGTVPCAALTHGFIKKTQKTPPSEIERAVRYRNDYFRRKGQK